MFLKSLDIFGFKSFADKTHVEFADGITALLGPNGCGKSNVVDAVKWVLAENKAKNLRADTMESVIFNGTESRPPLNIAEVTLTLCNENHILPLDTSEVALKRRIYRSGENEYYINNKQVNSIEIRRLFMDTGVGKAAYSVMEQGKIDQVLSSKPEDRRYLFEEAAGISRSKAECAEAERELERTRQNLEKIEAALNENKRTYETLKVQSEKTIKYKNLKEEIFNDELDIQLIKLRDFLQNKNQNSEKKEGISAKRAKVQQEIDELTASVTENNDKIKDLQTKMSELQQELIKIQTENTGKQEMEKKLKRDASLIKEKVGQLELHKQTLEERIDSLQEEIDEQDADFYAKTKQLGDVRSNIESFKDNINNAASTIRENEQKAKDGEEEIASLDTVREAFQKSLKAITEDIVTELDAKLKDSGFNAAASKKAKESLDEALGKLRIYADGRKKIFSDYDSINGHSKEESDTFTKEAIAAIEEIENLTKNVENAVQSYSKTVPSFIDDFLAPEGIITKKREIDDKINENLERIDEIKRKIESLKAENAGLSGKIAAYKETLGKLQVSEAQMSAQIEAAKSKTEILKRTIASEKNALAKNNEDLFNEQHRQEEINEQIEEIQSDLAEIERRGGKCVDEMNSLDIQIRECNSSVNGKQDALKSKQEEQRKLQAQYERLSLDLVTTENDIKNIKQNFIETHSRDLMEFEERMNEITELPSVLREKLSKAKEELKNLGQVNLMAVEEFGEAKERYEKLKQNFDDTNKSMEDLLRVAEEIKSKSTEMFLATYNKIRKNFHNMFKRMFGGGKGELKLSNPENVLTSGIDIYAQPPGKKLENIALLSGGEKTMTAVALLFATYQVRPSPFCLLDEIDAALDDKNVTSFVQALRSFAELSQYIVITHNKKTVLGAKTMLGVTMEESGISKIVTMRLDKDISADDEEERTLVEGDRIAENSGEFEEEDVEPEEGIVEVPRPPKRIHNPDGTITDPLVAIREKERKEAERKAREAEKQAKLEAKLASEKEAENFTLKVESDENTTENSEKN
ncbi:MAG: AAA family ATPase [Treponema sp.]|nr:AAA family ATPase [Treponema sp.]